MSCGHQTRSKASASGVRVATDTTIENDALNGVEQDNAEPVQKSPVCAFNEWDPLEVCVCVCVEHWIKCLAIMTFFVYCQVCT